MVGAEGSSAIGDAATSLLLLHLLSDMVLLYSIQY